jgi:hypothetical protein
MSLSNEVASIPAMVGNAIEQLGKLVGNEVQLARAELSEKVAHAGTGLAYVAASAVLMIPALVMLLTALALGLNQMGMSPVVSYGIVAAIGIGSSVILALTGLSHLKAKKLIPAVTLSQIERDAAVAREIIK